MPLDAGCTQQLQISRVKLVYLPLDHPAHGFRQFPPDIRNRFHQHPGLAYAVNHPTTAQITDQVGHKERISIRLFLNEGGKFLWEIMSGKLRDKITLDFIAAEEAQRDFTAQATRLKIQLDLHEGASGKQ